MRRQEDFCCKSINVQQDVCRNNSVTYSEPPCLGSLIYDFCRRFCAEKLVNYFETVVCYPNSTFSDMSLCSLWYNYRLHNKSTIKQGFHPTQRTQSKERQERNEMTSLLDKPITAASDDGVCRWQAAKLWQTHAIKYEIIIRKIWNFWNWIWFAS